MRGPKPGSAAAKAAGRRGAETLRRINRAADAPRRRHLAGLNTRQRAEYEWLTKTKRIPAAQALRMAKAKA